jgi:hypothetical protein
MRAWRFYSIVGVVFIFAGALRIRISPLTKAEVCTVPHDARIYSEIFVGTTWPAFVEAILYLFACLLIFSTQRKSALTFGGFYHTAVLVNNLFALAGPHGPNKDIAMRYMLPQVIGEPAMPGNWEIALAIALGELTGYIAAWLTIWLLYRKCQFFSPTSPQSPPEELIAR